MWVCGFTMTTLVEDDSPLEELLFDLHISIGVTLLAVLALRLAIRFRYRPPPPPVGLHRPEHNAARAVHAALYAFPAVVIGLGWAETNFGGHVVQWFGVGLPRVFPEAGEDLQDWAETLHQWFAYTMLALAAGHAMADT